MSLSFSKSKRKPTLLIVVPTIPFIRIQNKGTNMVHGMIFKIWKFCGSTKEHKRHTDTIKGLFAKQTAIYKTLYVSRQSVRSKNEKIPCWYYRIRKPTNQLPIQSTDWKNCFRNLNLQPGSSIFQYALPQLTSSGSGSHVCYTDPTRPLIRASIEILQQSGVRVKVVTSDSQEIAVVELCIAFCFQPLSLALVVK